MRLLILLVLVLIVSGCAGQDSRTDTTRVITEDFGVNAHFCPQDDCYREFYDFINDTEEKLYCGLFDLDLKPVIKLMQSKDIDLKIVVDNENSEELKGLDFVRFDDSSQFSHNKFCVRDNKTVWTGSFNPTENGAFYNNNNILVIYSKHLAENYLDEFEELWKGNYGNGKKVKNPQIKDDGRVIENYFCPEDDCSEKLIREIDNSTTVYFATFSFTDDRVANHLITTKNVKGVFESRQISQYSVYEKLNFQGLDVKKDSNNYNMHHKFFVFDNDTVLTGSYNPTVNGDTNNDENIVIIKDQRVAMKYVEEFQRLYNNVNTTSQINSSVFISKVYYDAEGSDKENEFVELGNTKGVDLYGWRLCDEVSCMMLENSSRVYMKGKVNLNNDEDTLKLYNRVGLVDSVKWGINLSTETGELLYRENSTSNWESIQFQGLLDH